MGYCTDFTGSIHLPGLSEKDAKRLGNILRTRFRDSSDEIRIEKDKDGYRLEIFGGWENYEGGQVVFASTGANGYYFRGFPQQRMQVDPNSEEGFQARTFNPSLGDVYYIGLFGTGRPSKWKDELADLDKAAGLTEK